VGIAATAARAATASDDALVRRAADGDVAAFDALIASRLDRCYRLAWSILGNEADAADATQDAFVLAWRQLPRLRDPKAFDGWLNRIVANASRMGRRHRTRLREVSIAPPPPRSNGALGRPNYTEVADDRPSEGDAVVEADALARAFDRLRPEDRSILVLHHVDERPVAEIARTLGIPVGTAKWRLHSARKSLERAMEAEA
jgi:RNA polymerase sigma-70 factor (ECF subfamily)